MKKRIAIIDADFLPYLCSKDSIEISVANVKSFIDTILEKTDTQYYALALSKPPYFRHRINPDYKGNRSGISPLKYLKTLKMFLYEEFKAFSHLGLEADDIVGWIRSELPEYDSVICSVDKDVLKQLPGRHYNYKNHEWIETSEEEAKEMLLMQWLSGDSVDNIKGLTGVGKAKAKKMVESINGSDNLLSLLQFYRKEFTKDIQVLEQLVSNYRQVYILRNKEDITEVIGEEMCPKIGDVVINYKEKDGTNGIREEF